MHILLGEKEYLDGVEISPDEIYAWADENEDTPKTSAVGFEEAALKEADSERVFITHSGCNQEMIDKVYAYLKDMDYFKEILITRAGGVISSHCGYGTLGVLYLKK